MTTPLALGAVLLMSAPALADEPLAVAEQRAFKAAVAAVAPSIVQVETFGGLDRVGETRTGTGPTSGVVLSPDGYVISSAFALASKPAAVLVTLPDGSKHDAKIFGTDFSRQLSLLKIDAAGLTPPATAAVADAEVGEWTLAVGKAFSPTTPNASPGVLSAKNRIWGRAVQTDAKTSPLNYGGPLIDVSGRVLGVVVPLSMTSDDAMAGADWYDSGIGFAVPWEQVTAAAERMKAGGDLRRGSLGIATTKPGNMFSVPEVAAVRDDSPAAKAGLEKGDRITAVAGQPVALLGQLQQALGPLYAGDAVEITFRRGDEEQAVTVTLEQPPEKPVKTDEPMPETPVEPKEGPLRGLGRSEGVAVKESERAVPRAEARGLGPSPHGRLEGDDAAGLAGQRVVHDERQHEAAFAVRLDVEAAGPVAGAAALDQLQPAREVVHDADVVDRLVAEVVVADREGHDLAGRGGGLVGQLDDPQQAGLVHVLGAGEFRRGELGLDGGARHVGRGHDREQRPRPGDGRLHLLGEHGFLAADDLAALQEGDGRVDRRVLDVERRRGRLVVAAQAVLDVDAAGPRADPDAFETGLLDFRSRRETGLEAGPAGRLGGADELVDLRPAGGAAEAADLAVPRGVDADLVRGHDVPAAGRVAPLGDGVLAVETFPQPRRVMNGKVAVAAVAEELVRPRGGEADETRG